MKKAVNIFLAIAAGCVVIVLLINLFVLKTVSDNKMSAEESLAKARAAKAAKAAKEQNTEDQNIQDDEKAEAGNN